MKQTDVALERCPDCGKYHLVGAQVLPDVEPAHFVAARRIAALVWDEANEHETPPISTVCLTAALLLKRAAVSLGLPLEALDGFAQTYLELAHRIIQWRRRSETASKDTN